MAVHRAKKVLVLGRGVLGVSAAYHLAKLGAGEVVTVGSGPVGASATARAAGLLMMVG